MSTKIHLAVNERGKAVRIILGPGQESDYKKAGELIYGFKASALLADKGYDANWLEEAARKQGINSIVIPSKSYRNPKRIYDKTLYRDRNIIERFFKRLKHYRRVASRFDKTARNFMAMTSIAATIINQML